MKKICIFLFLVIFLTQIGCGKQYAYKGNTFPDLSSPVFDLSLEVESIPSEVRYNLPIGNWKQKTKSKIDYYKNEKFPTSYSDLTSETSMYEDKNLIVVKGMSESSTTLLGKNITSSSQISAKYDSSGKELEFNIEKSENIDNNAINLLKATKLKQLQYLIQNRGKIVKVGDVYSRIPYPQADQLKGIFPAEGIPEVVKGLCNFNDKKAICTESVFDEKFTVSDAIFEMRGKIYNLYDVKTFAPIYSKGVSFMLTFTPHQGTEEIKMESITEIVDSQFVTTSLQTKVLSNESNQQNTPPTDRNDSWLEASDKLKKLGELLDKKLISKEEYEEKKTKLLKNF